MRKKRFKNKPKTRNHCGRHKNKLPVARSEFNERENNDNDFPSIYEFMNFSGSDIIQLCWSLRRQLCEVKQMLEDINLPVSDETTQYRYEYNNQYDSAGAKNEYMTTEEAANFLNVSRRTIYNYRKEKKLPVYYLNNKLPRYKRSDIEKLLERSEDDLQ